MVLGFSIGKNLTRNTSMIFLCQTKPNLMLKSGKTTVSCDKKWPKTFFLQCFEVFTPLPSISMAIGSKYNWRFQKGIFKILILAQDRCAENKKRNKVRHKFNFNSSEYLSWWHVAQQINSLTHKGHNVIIIMSHSVGTVSVAVFGL